MKVYSITVTVERGKKKEKFLETKEVGELSPRNGLEDDGPD